MIEIERDECFEYAVMMALLSRKPVKFLNCSNIDENVEILDYFKIISPSTNYKISENSIEIEPDYLIGGKITEKVDRIPLCLNLLITISPFLADNIELELTGITNYNEYSIDIFKVTFFKIFRLFGLPSFDLNVKKRGFAPEGSGIIKFKGCPVKFISGIDFQTTEPISKIRGFVITSRVGSDIAHRMINKIKDELSDMANTKVLCIVNNRNDSGPSPGYECSVLAESDNSVFYETLNNKEVPEKMAEECCRRLMKNILNAGFIDKKLLPIVILYMGLSKGVNNLPFVKLDKTSKRILELLSIFFSTNYKIRKLTDMNILTIVGCSYKNIYKPI